MIPLTRVLQVSNCLDILYIYYTDIVELERAHPGPFRVIFDPPCYGGQNHKNRDYAWRGSFAISGMYSSIHS